ncbi:hypothetical protein A3L09_09625 [Thermococcus profundus]|uniref:Uncharacterized protein n=2 Tax=Thermococcus profundus TaxID=49899 RepID=A0A2Z2MA92_THEPR|nr:hypothetical protein A3L09_09625 [Thermococcus profundus]
MGSTPRRWLNSQEGLEGIYDLQNMESLLGRKREMVGKNSHIEKNERREGMKRGWENPKHASNYGVYDRYDAGLYGITSR